MAQSDDSITEFLQRFAGGDKSALDHIMPLVYAEMQKMAGGYLRNEKPDHTLQPTALVHEAYARLIRQEQPDYRSRAHFMAVAANVMRHILIDHARGRNAAKRGSGEAKISLEQAGEIPLGRPSVLIAIDDALEELARKDALKAKLIEMRFFGGLTAEESAEAVGIEVNEVRRHLRVAHAWLRRELDRTGNASGAARAGG
jgi:RNA polymerase sigma factor (TIGR02999 family)